MRFHQYQQSCRRRRRQRQQRSHEYIYATFIYCRQKLISIYGMSELFRIRTVLFIKNERYKISMLYLSHKSPFLFLPRVTTCSPSLIQCVDNKPTLKSHLVVVSLAFVRPTYPPTTIDHSHGVVSVGILLRESNPQCDPH